MLTIKPLSTVLGLDINDSFADKQYAGLAATLLGDHKYDGKVILISWHHGEIPALAGALKATGMPTKWPDDRFDLIWRLDYSGEAPTLKIMPQLLLYGDGLVDGAS